MVIMRAACFKLVLLVGLFSVSVAGQNGADSSIPFAFAPQPTNCEQNRFRFESYAALFNRVKERNGGGVLIAVARLGTGERSRNLNRTRLYVVRATLIEDLGLQEPEVVTAEGERVNGLGRIEVYIGGELVDTLLIHRAKGLCADCCYTEGRKYDYPHHKPKPPKQQP